MNKIIQLFIIFIIINELTSINITITPIINITEQKIFNKVNNTMQNNNDKIFYYLASLIVI